MATRAPVHLCLLVAGRRIMEKINWCVRACECVSAMIGIGTDGGGGGGERIFRAAAVCVCACVFTKPAQIPYAAHMRLSARLSAVLCEIQPQTLGKIRSDNPACCSSSVLKCTVFLATAVRLMEGYKYHTPLSSAHALALELWPPRPARLQRWV